MNLNSLTLALLSNKDLRDQYPSKEFIGYLKMLLMSENAGVVGRRVSGVCGEEVEMGCAGRVGCVGQEIEIAAFVCDTLWSDDAGL